MLVASIGSKLTHADNSLHSLIIIEAEILHKYLYVFIVKNSFMQMENECSNTLRIFALI